MKKIFFCISLSILFAMTSNAQTQTLHDFSAETIFGDTLDLSTLYGKKVLVVNTASFCGFTYEYGLLQDLYDLYGGSNFQILGFPSDDFNQEPEDDSTIYEFCLDVYGITFQMMSKTHVKGIEICEVYDWLTHESENGVDDAPVLWNFQKFAVDELGNWVKWFPHQMSPLDTSIVNWILSPSVIGTSIDEPAGSQNQLNVYQNASVIAEYISETNSPASFALTDISGRLIFEKNFTALAGKNVIRFESPVSGIYIASVITNSNRLAEKVIIAY